MNLEWMPDAIEQLDDLEAYISDHDPAAAKRVVQAIRERAEILVGQPRLGREGRLVGTRELILAPLPYIVIYRVADTRVEVLAVISGARQFVF